MLTALILHLKQRVSTEHSSHSPPSQFQLTVTRLFSVRGAVPQLHLIFPGKTHLFLHNLNTKHLLMETPKIEKEKSQVNFLLPITSRKICSWLINLPNFQALSWLSSYGWNEISSKWRFYISLTLSIQNQKATGVIFQFLFPVAGSTPHIIPERTLEWYKLH
jgi:hypothetical protein